MRRDGPLGDIEGAGILLSPEFALTAAHVVGDPDHAVWLDFPEVRAPDGAPAVPGVAATVAPGGWFPAAHDPADGDVAVLRLAGPRHQGTPAPLSRRVPEPEDALRIGGYPVEQDDGMWVRATQSGPHGQLYQLDPRAQREVVRPGFSGGAVLNLATERVVGMVLRRYADDEHDRPAEERAYLSYMIPVRRIVQISPTVRRLYALTQGELGEYGRSLDHWFDRVHEHGGEPAVRITPVVRDGGHAAVLGQRLHRADLVLDAAGAATRDLADRIARAGPCRDPDAPVVVVIGVDEAADPPSLIRLLGQCALRGARLLLVIRERVGPVWERLVVELRLPSVVAHCGDLLVRLRRAEAEHDRRWKGGSLAGKPHIEPVAVARYTEYARLASLPDPFRQLRAADSLAARLREDLTHVEARCGQSSR
ncbi:serine protease [Streptomyces sp. NPDC050504]|uniref:serine protease n=1 Tax=Streptomyces sp. NPDC050504 TaxID=3365618 RepID=UPI00379EC1F0